MNKERKSNIELLRAISMFMVLLLHVNLPLSCTDRSFFLKLGVESVSIVAVNIFVLITGYFGTSFRLSRIANLCFQILFTVVPITLLLYVFHLVTFSTFKEFLLGFRFWHYWFVNAYIALLVLCPVLNAAIKCLKRQHLKLLLISLFIVFSIIQGDFIITPPGPGIDGGHSAIWFLFLYLVGRYIAVYPSDVSCSRLMCLYFGCLVGTFLLLWFLDNKSYNNPFIFMQSVALFCLFLKLNISSKSINIVSSSSLMVFLLHCHPLLVKFFRSTVIVLNNKYGYTFEFLMIISCFCIFVYGIAIVYDQFRKYFWHFIQPRIRFYDDLFILEDETT